MFLCREEKELPQEPNGPVERALKIVMGSGEISPAVKKGIKSTFEASRNGDFKDGKGVLPDVARALIAEISQALQGLKAEIAKQQAQDSNNEAVVASPPRGLT